MPGCGQGALHNRVSVSKIDKTRKQKRQDRTGQEKKEDKRADTPRKHREKKARKPPHDSHTRRSAQTEQLKTAKKMKFLTKKGSDIAANEPQEANVMWTEEEDGTQQISLCDCCTTA